MHVCTFVLKYPRLYGCLYSEIRKRNECVYVFDNLLLCVSGCICACLFKASIGLCPPNTHITQSLFFPNEARTSRYKYSSV